MYLLKDKKAKVIIYVLPDTLLLLYFKKRVSVYSSVEQNNKT